MVGLIKFFKREDPKWYRLDQFLKYSFLKIKEDIQNISLWMHHFHEKHQENEQHHFYFNEELKYHKSMISHLDEQIKTLKNELETAKIEKGQVRTSQGQVRTSQGQVRTSQGQVRTSQGQVKDMSLKTKDKSGQVKKIKSPQEIKVFDKELLAESHTELLNLLYHSDKPLGYENISRILGKKEKSIRNLIYELREKGVTINTKPIGIRKKGFFLPHEEKIRVSGR